MKHLNKIHHYTPDLSFKDNQLIYVPTNTILFKVDKGDAVSVKGDRIIPIDNEKNEYEVIDAFTNFAYRLDELSKTLKISKNNFIITDDIFRDHCRYIVSFTYNGYRVKYKVSMLSRYTKQKIAEEIIVEQNGEKIYEFNITNKSFSLLKKTLEPRASKKSTPQTQKAKPPENIDTQPSATETESETSILQNLEKFLLSKGLPEDKTKLIIERFSYEYKRQPEILVKQAYKNITNTFEILYRNKEGNYFLVKYELSEGIHLIALHIFTSKDEVISSALVKKHGLDISKEQYAKMIVDGVIALRREKDEQMGEEYLEQAMKKYKPWLKKLYMENTMDDFADIIKSLASLDYTTFGISRRLNIIAVGVGASPQEIENMMTGLDKHLAKILLEDNKLSNEKVIEKLIADISKYQKHEEQLRIINTDIGHDKLEEIINDLRKVPTNLLKMVRAGIFNVNNIRQAKQINNYVVNDYHTLGYFKGEYNPSLKYYLSTDVRNVELAIDERRPEYYTIKNVYGQDHEQIYDLLMKKGKPFYKRETVDKFLKLFRNKLTPQIIVKTKKNEDGSVKYEPSDILLLALDSDEHIYIAPLA